MSRIAQAVPVLPVPLAARVLAETPEIATADALARADAIGAALAGRGAHLVLPLGSVRTGLEAGIDNLAMRGIVTRQGDRLRVTEGNEGVIAFYAASVSQLLDAPAA